MSETTTRRFAVSTLSKSKVSEAYSGELIGDKYIGEILYKTPDGDAVSYMANSRKLYNVNRLADAMRHCGYNAFSIYEAGTDSVLPAIITPGASIPVPVTESVAHKFTAYSILIDIDCLEKNIDGFTSVNLDAPLLVGVKIYSEGSEEPVAKTMTCTVSELKSKVFTTQTEATNIELSVVTNLPDGYADSDCRLILHSIMVATNNIGE